MKSNKFSKALILLTATMFLTGCVSNTSANTTTTDIGQVTQITLTNTIDVAGSISPRQIAAVNWSVTGTVASVNVMVGQQVEKGDVLMTLDISSLPENLEKTRQELAELCSPAAVASAQQKVLEAQDAYDTAVQNRMNLDYQDEDLIENAYAEFILAKARYEEAYENYLNWKDEDESDHYETDLAVAYTAMYKAKTEMETAQYIYELYKSKSSAQTYAEYDNAVVLAQNALLEAQNYLTLITGGEIPEDTTSPSIQEFRQKQNALDAINLRAPITGTVAAIYDEPGMLVTNNHTSVKIVDSSALYLGVSMEESDIAQISIGLPAIVNVDIFPDLELSGHIYSIDPVGTISNGVVYYTVEIELDETDVHIPINASASASIQIGEPEIKLLVPATAVQSDDTGEFVQVITDGTYKRVDVVSGTIMSDDTVVVEGDLEVGDFVLLIIETTASEEETGGDFGIFGGGGDRGEMPAGGGQVPQGGQQPPSGGPQVP
ncbi:MAG: HlyD family efflux transporter periplasmic adaptor subunit [Chloroflexi bacterium]|jgi:multidrug efflux pump subunit AcrA (membrane-fusion protein)|nr:efflux RND transporter periplasmic adaptor subunit [Anaerolineaceae bacterium]NLI44519.1 HlyD family efflux transporter periplasmic adaptor subunit [Chloroflexota bacterium]HOE34760.1 efflux RND transporter periplasmic adaptor subunit [Anaerolineaceae bacterium]HOT25333.1 efflux RND transporter periplasmic adaptor subunit [Anaerolineaceae bacterium]HQH57360.1 efflux RND transporter periplasmic adaptor subunit [Anaerolineaceae bacterium]